MVRTTLILDRGTGDLWVDVDDMHVECIWDVTGLERDEESFFGHVKILRNGEQIGGCWFVEEIQERWEKVK